MISDGRFTVYIIEMFFDGGIIQGWRKVDLRQFLLKGPYNGLTDVEKRVYYECNETGIKQSTYIEEDAINLCRKLREKFEDRKFRVAKVPIDKKTTPIN